jgi:two-component system, OmpR family, phosphate regulon sensor histidine kinase PhoR
MAGETHEQILDLMVRPALLISGDRIEHANPAAQAMLGSHISGQDARLALRHPDVVALIMGNHPGTVKITGLSTPGSLWEVSCHDLDRTTRLVTLEDLSAQVGIARAHADFVANASHELRTPLASVLGYIDTLKDPKAGDDVDTRNRFLDIIKHEAERMHALVDDLMSLSRIEALKHDAPTEKIDIASIAREVVGEFCGKAVIERAAADPAMIMGDRGQMAQVIRNLIDNAIKYGAAGEPATIKLETVATGWVTVEVSDRGEGIAAEHIPRLTERFYRVDAGRSRKVGGTGLGLSIVKHIVERHRGRLDIRSRPGEGTTSSIMLPLIRGA